MTQIGPVARAVRDLVLTFPLIAGEDGRDSGVIPMPIGDADAVVLRGLRLATYTDDGEATPIKEIAEAVQTAASALSDAGVAVDETRPSCLSYARGITERYWKRNALSGTEVERLFADWDRFRSAMLAFMARYDVILCPVDARPAPRHGEQPASTFNYTLPFSLTGWPCAVVRAGVSPDGLPIGVQIVARSWREDIVLAVALHLEGALGGWQRPPL